MTNEEARRWIWDTFYSRAGSDERSKLHEALAVLGHSIHKPNDSIQTRLPEDIIREVRGG